MSSNTIHINSEKPIRTLLAEIETEILSSAWKFTSTNKKGQFSGKTVLGQIQGEYHVEEQKIIIRITKRSLVVPVSKIKSQIAN